MNIMLYLCRAMRGSRGFFAVPIVAAALMAVIVTKSANAATATNEATLNTYLAQSGTESVTIAEGTIDLTAILNNSTRPKEITGAGDGAVLNGAGGVGILNFGTGSGTIAISNITFTQANTNERNANGGAIATTGETSMNLTKTVFTGNRTSQNGGAIYTRNHWTGDIVGSTFANNYAGAFGGAIYVTGSFKGDIDNNIFENNFSEKDGGVFYFSSMEMAFEGNITNSKFLNNTSNGGSGGSAFGTSGSFKGNIVDTEFIGNTSNGNQGTLIVWDALQADPDEYVGMKRVTFKDNTSAGMGGAIGAYRDWRLDISDSEFEGNHADTYGGAIAVIGYNTGDAMVGNIDGTVFKGNTAGSHGGAIAVKQMLGTISDSTFENNEADTYGGAISTTEGGLGDVTNTLFAGNSAENGGAVSLGSQAAGSATFINSTFTNNTASDSGGAVFVQNGGTLTFRATANETMLLSGNTANGAPNAVGLHGDGHFVAETEADGILDMLDSVSGDASAGKTITITKTGSGTWRLGGESHITATSDGKTEFTITDGVLHLYGAGEAPPVANNTAAVTDGIIILEGNDSAFAMADGATLSLGGANVVSVADGTIELGDNILITAALDMDASLVLTSADGEVAVGENLEINVAGQGRAFTLDAVLAETAADTAMVKKTGAGVLALARQNAMAGTPGLNLAEGSLASSQNQEFKTLTTASGADVAMADADLRIGQGALDGAVSVKNFRATGDGALDVKGKMTVAREFKVDTGHVGIHIDMNSPTVIADTAVFGDDTPLVVTGYTGDGSEGSVVVIQTTQAIADADMPTTYSVSGLFTSPYDFMRYGVTRGEENKSILISSSFAWYEPSVDDAHGDFTLDGGQTFTLDMPLADRDDRDLLTRWDGITLSKKGDGTLVLSGVNTYSGGSNVEAGTLVLTNDSAAGTGTAALSGAATLILDYDGGFANAVTGAGVLEARGVNYLTGDMSGHTGETRIIGASFLGAADGGVATSGAAFRVMDGGSLGGNGTINHLVVHRGGTLAPGHSIGGIYVTGNATFEAGSFFDVETDPATGAADILAVTGTADLGGATVRHVGLGDESDYGPVGEWTILTAAGGYGATRFADQVEGGYLFLDQTLEYRGGTDVLLVITRNASNFGDFANTPNQAAVAGALDSMSTGALHNDLVSLPAGTDMADVLDQLSGEMHASVRGLLHSYDRDFARTMMRRVFNPNGVECGLGLWAAMGGVGIRGDGGVGVAKATQRGVNLSLGVEQTLAGGARFGAAFRFGRTEIKAKDRHSKADVDSFSLGLYGGDEIALGSGSLNWALGASYGYHDLDATRHLSYGGRHQTLDSGYHAHSAQVMAEVGYDFTFGGRLKAGPFAQAAWNSVWTNAFAEHGGNAALSADREHRGNFSHVLGLRARAKAGDRFALEAGAGWLHTYGGLDTRSRFVFRDGGPRFSINGVSLPRDAAVVSAGMNFAVSPRFGMWIGYDGVYGDEIKSHGGGVSFQLTF